MITDVSEHGTVGAACCHEAMRPSPHHSDVFSHLPVLLMRAMQTEQVAALLDGLVGNGWRPAQLRHRVGAEQAQGGVDRDAEHLVALLVRLSGEPSPDAAYAEQVRARQRDRADAASQAPTPAAPETREQHLAEIRSSLRGLPHRPREPEPRLRPECNLCGGEGLFFVTHEVHLCGRCVEVLASGEVSLRQVG